MPSIPLTISNFNSVLAYLFPAKKEKLPPAACPIADKLGHDLVMHMDAIELSRVFQMFDHNGDGRITAKELNDSLMSMGIFIADKELMQMIERVDANGDGCVDIDEFEELYRSIMKDRDEEKEMLEAFNVFDQNSDGFITVDELQSVLVSLGVGQGRAAADECRLMIKRVDGDGDGRVNFNEFKQMLRGGGFTSLTN